MDPVGLIGAVGVTTVAVKASGCSISVAMAMRRVKVVLPFVVESRWRVRVVRVQKVLELSNIAPNQTGRNSTAFRTS